MSILSVSLNSERFRGMTESNGWRLKSHDISKESQSTLTISTHFFVVVSICCNKASGKSAIGNPNISPTLSCNVGFIAFSIYDATLLFNTAIIEYIIFALTIIVGELELKAKFSLFILKR